MAEGLTDLLADEVKEKIDHWLTKYPADQRRSAVIPALHIVQQANGGWLTTELMDAVADYLQIAKIAVYEVATFYSMYERQEVGRNKIALCTNVSCMLCGSEKIAAHIKAKLGIDFGQSTADGKFFLKEVECLAACGGAPMMQINDKEYHEDLTPEKVDSILETLE